MGGGGAGEKTGSEFFLHPEEVEEKKKTQIKEVLWIES